MVLEPLQFLLNYQLTMTMTTIFFTILIIVLSIFHLDAFLPNAPPRARRPQQVPKRNPNPQLYPSARSPLFRSQQALKRDDSSLKESADENSNEPSSSSSSPNTNALTHADVTWKLRPPTETGRLKRWWLRFAANLIRLDCLIFRKEAPIALCPKGGQAVLEAHCQDAQSGKLVKVGRFGFSTERGPPAPPIQETVSELYGIAPNILVGVGAIIYMFVEPEYRKRDIGRLALEVISLIQAIQGIDFTILVVDDNGSGKLIEWYLKNGYSKAPKLQDILGSPDGKNGITMIAPTNSILPFDCRIQWW